MYWRASSNRRRLTQPHQHRQRIERRLGEAGLQVEGHDFFIDCMAKQRAHADQLCGLDRSQHDILEQSAAKIAAKFPARPVAVHGQSARHDHRLRVRHVAPQPPRRGGASNRNNGNRTRSKSAVANGTSLLITNEVGVSIILTSRAPLPLKYPVAPRAAPQAAQHDKCALHIATVNIATLETQRSKCKM